MRHRKATWTQAKVPESNQSCAVNTTELDQPAPHQGHMESLQRMARRNKRSLESSEHCWVKMEFEQRGKKHQADLCGARPHKFKIFALQQADKPQQCRTAEAALNPQCLMLSPQHETSHALKRLNTCHLATFLVRIY